LRVTPNSNPSTGSGSGVEGEREKAEEMVMLAPRSNASGRQHGCPRLAVLSVHGWVAATSSRRHHRGSLLGYLDAYLHGHGPVAGLAALPSIQCLRPWSSSVVEKNGGEEGSVGVLDWLAATGLIKKT
jgi:hypothetical protein